MRHIRHPKQSPTYQCSAHVMHCLTHYKQEASVSLRAAWNYTILAHVTLHCVMHTIRPITHIIIGLIENAKKRGNLAAATANLPARSQACVAWSKVSSLESRQPPAKHLWICPVLTNPHASICLAGNLFDSLILTESKVCFLARNLPGKFGWGGPSCKQMLIGRHALWKCK